MIVYYAYTRKSYMQERAFIRSVSPTSHIVVFDILVPRSRYKISDRSMAHGVWRHGSCIYNENKIIRIKLLPHDIPMR